MGRFKDRTGHSRWAEARLDIGRFIDDYGEKAGPVLKAVIKMAVPRASAVIDAISEVRSSKMTGTVKEKTVKHLESLLKDLDGDGEPDILQAIPNDFPLKKYITPALVVLSVANYLHLQILSLYAIRPVPEHMMEMATGLMWTCVGLWQTGRIIVNREATKKILA